MSEDFYATVGTHHLDKRRRNGANTVTLDEAQPSDPSQKRDMGASRWSHHEGKFWGSSQTREALPAGLYRCGHSPNIGFFLDAMLNDTDEIMRLPDSQAEAVLQEVVEFTTLKGEFQKRGFLYKRGILLWGPPGSGKTCTLRLLIQMVIEQLGGVAIFLDHPHTAANCLQLARKIEPQRQIIALLEDMDALADRFGENEYLALLDGESQIDNVIYVATTNYPERLDPRFVDRPSRFDTIQFVGMPSTEARRMYLRKKEPSLTAEQLEQYVSASDGFSIAHLRELVILTQCFQRPLDQAVKRLNGMRQQRPNSTRNPNSAAFGFGGGS